MLEFRQCPDSSITADAILVASRTAKAAVLILRDVVVLLLGITLMLPAYTAAHDAAIIRIHVLSK